MFAIAEAVTEERIRPLPKNAEVPPWIRRILLTGLHKNPRGSCFPSVESVVLALLTFCRFGGESASLQPPRRSPSLRCCSEPATGLAAASASSTWKFPGGSIRRKPCCESFPSSPHDFKSSAGKALAAFDSGDPRAEDVWKYVLSSWSTIDAKATTAFAELDAARRIAPSDDSGRNTRHSIARATPDATSTCRSLLIGGGALSRLPRPNTVGI